MNMTKTDDVWSLNGIETIHMEMMRVFTSLDNFPALEKNFPDLSDKIYDLKEKFNIAFVV